MVLSKENKISNNDDLKIIPFFYTIYTLPGKPTPLARPRASKYSVYDSQKEIKKELRQLLKVQHKEKAILSGPLELNVTFFMPIPKSTPKKYKEALIRAPHPIKPDLSNLLKFLEDIAAGIIFIDDKSIVSITARKLYDTVPRTIFSLRPLHEKNYEKDKEKNPPT